MSQQIDNQIVKMQFDNASFEQNVKQSMSTLDKLKAALKFEKVDMTPLQKAFNETEATATKAGFSIRDIWLKVASTIENEVAQKIVDTGKKIMNALTFEGVMDGFAEYELKMGSIQTIMAGTGESLATVNRYLDDLNTYSDKTISSFADMTQNIGKFTNAGVKLNDAVNAIKGIANEAAVSGANTNEASRAMYNFAQALSAGYVKLIDWKSIENANMATVEFKDTLLKVASATGTVAKSADGMYQVLTTNAQGKTMKDLVSNTKNFNDSLQYQWMTTEVLTETLGIYATDIRELTQAEKESYEERLRKLGFEKDEILQFERLGIKAADAATEIKTFTMLIDTLKEAIGSGWAQTWQLFIGDFEQAKALWTEVGTTLGNLISDVSNARNEFLKEGLQTGWEAFTTMTGRAIPESERFRDVLVDLAKEHGILSEQQYVEINSTETLVKSFHELGWVTGDLLVEAVDDYTTILRNMTKEERESIGITDDQMTELSKLRLQLKSGSIDADAFAESMNKLGGRENIIRGLKNVFEALVNALKPIGQAFDDVFGVMDPTKLYDLTVRFREFTEQLKVSEDAANTIKTSFTLAFKGVKTVIDGIGTAIKGVTKLVLPLLNLFDALFGVVGKAISALTGSNGALEVADKFGKIGDKISSKYLAVMQKLADLINRVANAIRNLPESPVFSRIHEGAENAILSLQRLWNEFTQLPIIQQMVADFWATVDSIEAKITPVVESVKKAFDDMYQTVDSKLTWDSVNDTLTKVYDKVKKVIDIVKDFGTRIKDFFQGLKDGKTVVESFQENFGDFIEKFNELKQNLDEFFDNLFKKGDELGTKFNLEDIANSIHEFVKNITPEQVTMLAVAGTFTLIAINMLRLSDAVREAVESFTGMGKAIKNVINSYVKKQKSVVLQIAESIVIVAAALWMLSTIPKDELEQSVSAITTVSACLAVLTIALGAVGVALNKLGGNKSMIELASGLVLVASSLMLVAGAMKVLEYVDLEGIAPKLAVMAVIMAALVAISAVMNKLAGFNKGVLTLVAVSASLLIAASALKQLADIPTDQIMSSVTAMAMIMVGLAAVAAASGKVGLFSAVGVVAVVLTMEKLMPAIESIVNYDFDKIQEGLKKNEETLKKIGIVVGVMVAIGALAGNRLKGAAAAMLSISATFAILIGVAKLAGMMDPRELAKGEDFLTHMALLIALMEICARKSEIGMWGGKNGGEGSKMFIRIALAMGVMLGIAKLASMMEAKDIAKGELAVAGLVVLIGLMAGAAKLCGNTENVIKPLTGMLFGLSLILAEVALLSMIPMANMAPAIAAVVIVMAALAGLALALSKYTNSFAKAPLGQTITATISLIMAAVAVVAAGVMMNNLAKQPIANVATAAAAMVGVISAMALLVSALGRIQGKGSMAQLQAAAEAIAIVWVISSLLGYVTNYIKQNDLDPNTMIKAAASIALVLVGITPALAALSLFEKGKLDYWGMAEAVIGAISVLASVAIAIGALSNYGGDNIMEAGISLAIGLVAVSAPLAVLGAVGKFCQNINGKAMGAVVLAAIGVLIGVGGAIWALSTFGNADTLVQAAQALGIALVAISVPIAVLGAVGTLCQSANVGVMMGTVAAAVLGLAGIAAVLVAFSNYIDDAAIKKINDVMPSLCEAIAAVGLFSIAISVAGLFAEGAAAGFLVVVASLVSLGLVLTAIAGLGKILKENEAVNQYLITGLDMLVTIAGKIGEMAGAFIGGFGVGISSQLEPIAENLNKFASKMVVFSNTMSKVNKEAVTGAKNLAAAMLYICAAEFLDGLTRWLGLGHPNFDFEPLGIAVAKFCEAIKDIPQDAVTKASTCSVIAKRLAEITSILDAEGGVVQWFFGSRDLGKFAENIQKFGEAIKNFCEAVDGIPENAKELAQRAADAAVPMVDLTRALVADDGLLQRIIGHKNLGEFGERLTSFAESLKTFIEKLNEIEGIAPNYPELVTKCTQATNELVELSNSMENMGGFAGLLAGDNTLKKFGETLPPFAEALAKYSTALNDVDFGLIESVNSKVRELVDLGNFVSGVGADAFSGLKFALEDAAQMPVSAMANEISVGTPNLITAVNEMFNQLVAAVASRNASDKPTYTNYGRDLVLAIRQGIVDNYEPQIIPACTAMINRIKTYLNTSMAVTMWLLYGKYITTGIKNGITNNVEGEVIFALRNMISSIRTMLSTEMAHSKFTEYGNNVSTGLADGIEARADDAYRAAYNTGMNVSLQLKSGMEDYAGQAYDAAKAAGSNVALGLRDGINEHADEAVDAARDMAERVNAEVEKVEKINSPSKVMYEYGKYIDQGLAKGITDYTGEAVGATGSMATGIVNSANSIISRITDILNGNIDTQPVIRPVLDTTDLEANARNIGSLFDSNDLAMAYSASGSIRQMAQAKAAMNINMTSEQAAATGSTGPITVNMNVYASEDMDYKAMAEYIEDTLVDKIYNKGAVYA